FQQVHAWFRLAVWGRRKLEPCMRPICWAVIDLMETLPAEIRRRAEQPNVIFMGPHYGCVPLEESYAHLARRPAAAVIHNKLSESAERRVDSHAPERCYCLRPAE